MKRVERLSHALLETQSALHALHETQNALQETLNSLQVTVNTNGKPFTGNDSRTGRTLCWCISAFQCL